MEKFVINPAALSPLVSAVRFMKTKWFACTFVFLISFAVSTVLADDDKGDGKNFSKNATFTTLIPTPRALEGLTGDNSGNLYVGGSGPTPCPIWKINLHNPSLTVVGNVPAISPVTICGFSGIAFDELGQGRVWKITGPGANCTASPAVNLGRGVPNLANA